MPTNPPHLRPPELSSRAAISEYAGYKSKKAKPVFCFQIGANDGRINDPVHRHLSGSGWSGLLVEPLTGVFENELKRTYAEHPQVRLANVAIAPHEGQLPLYRVGFSDARWATGLSSFKRESLEAHVENGYIEELAKQDGIVLPTDKESWIVSTPVRTTTVARLLDEYGIARFDFLCIDTEGFDFEVLKLVDLARYAPEFVLYESKNLSNEDYEASKALFGDRYRLFWDKGDTFAVRIGSDADRTTRRLKDPLRQMKRRLWSRFRRS